MKALRMRSVRLFERWILNLHESRTLAALRDTLLPKLISGEVRVGDAARFVGSHETRAKDTSYRLITGRTS